MNGPKTSVPMRCQPPDIRITNFKEVPLGYTQDEACLESERCLQCKHRPCVQGCPVHIRIPDFIQAIKEKNFQYAIDLIHESDSLPAVTGRVCPQEEQCQLHCVLNKTGSPVSIGRMERFVADWDIQNRLSQSGDPPKTSGVDPQRPPSSTKKIAVVGSGPAGLACAADLAKSGYAVTVYEGFHEPGGVLVYGIPEFRLPKQIVTSEIDLLKTLGVQFETNVLIGRALTIKDLFNQGFHAIFLGTGAGLPNFMEIPGEQLNGIYSANEYLTRVNLMRAYQFPEYHTPIKKGKNIAVIGAGNVAMDCARTALRLNAENVFLIYRRSKEEMPARHEEIEHAVEEGVQLHLLTNPLAYRGDDHGFVNQVQCIKMELGEPDASGRRSPRPRPGSEFTLDIDLAIVAIGTTPNPIIARTTPDLKVKKRGEIQVDDNLMTSIPGVFAGGDIVTGAATVITAMGAGKKAAASIDTYLKTLR